MKTINDIQIEINHETRVGESAETKSQRSKAAARVAFLRRVKYYLESNPDPALIQRELDTVNFKIKKIIDDAHANFRGLGSDLMTERFYKMMDMARLKTYRDTLEFLLK